MTLIQGIPDYTKPDFTQMTDKELMKININTDLVNIYEAKDYAAEMRKRGLWKTTEQV